MKRTSVMLPDDVAELVDRERRRRDVSAATVIREAVEAYLVEPDRPGIQSIIGIVGSGKRGDWHSGNVEEFLDRYWADDIEESSGLRAARERKSREENKSEMSGADPGTDSANAGHS